MKRKYWTMGGLVLALAVVSVYLNSGVFRSEAIQIVHRPGRAVLGADGKRSRSPVTPIRFNFDRTLALTEVKVFHWAEAQTNQYAHPLWHLVSDSNSVPTRGIVYGTAVPGMRSSFEGATADPLQPGVRYRLWIEAGDRTAEHDFVAVPAAN